MRRTHAPAARAHASPRSVAEWECGVKAERTRRSLTIILSVLILIGEGGVPSHAVTADPISLPCFLGTGVTAPSPSPYPARAFLPLALSFNTATCVAEIEPNDTHSAAQVVTGSCVAASTVSSADADWYALRVCSPVTLTVRTTGPLNSVFDIDLYLHGDPPGVPLASSEGPGLAEVVSARLITGTYYALVQPAVGSGSYTLMLETRR